MFHLLFLNKINDVMYLFKFMVHGMDDKSSLFLWKAQIL